MTRILAPLPDLGVQGRATWRTLGQAASRGAVAGPLLQLAVIAVGGLALTDGRLTPGQLFAALQYAALGAGLGAVVTVLSQLVRARAGCERIAGVLAGPCRGYGGAELPAGPGRLELRGVTVRVGGQPALDAVDVTVPGGALVAVVGRSGAGKSLLAAVAGRLIDPDEGEVTLDGVPLADLDRVRCAGPWAYAFERPVLVGETVADAISLAGLPSLWGGSCGQGGPDRHRDRTAAGRVSRRRWPPPRSPAARCSGLGLARALGADRLLVLDDATSSVDTVTEHQLNQALAGGRRTCAPGCCVAHRAATAAARADLVIWLDDGRVRASGSHRVLWRVTPPTGRLFQRPVSGRDRPPRSRTPSSVRTATVWRAAARSRPGALAAGWPLRGVARRRACRGAGRAGPYRGGAGRWTTGSSPGGRWSGSAGWR